MKLIDEHLLSLLITVAMSGGAFLFLRLWNGIAEVNRKFDKIIQKVTDLELKLVGCYISKKQFETTNQILFNKIDKLSDEIHRLDHSKADR